MGTKSCFPFDTLEDSFQLLVTGPEPLSIDLTGIGGGLPSREMPLNRLRDRLLHPSVSFAARNEAIGRLVNLAQSGGSAYVVGLAGVLLPGLRRAAAPMFEACPTCTEDLESEMLRGLLEAIEAETLVADRVASRLIWAASRRARKLLFAELTHATRRESLPATFNAGLPGGHPDLVLQAAIDERIVTAEDAELVGETRIAEVPLDQLSAALGLPYNTLQKRRRRAELALIDWLFSDRLSAKGPKPRFIGGGSSSRKRRQPAARNLRLGPGPKEVRTRPTPARPFRELQALEAKRPPEKGVRIEEIEPEEVPTGGAGTGGGAGAGGGGSDSGSGAG